MIKDRDALLLFSGGETRKDVDPRSEAQSYWSVAESHGWFCKEKKLFPEDKSESAATSGAKKYPYWHSTWPSVLLQSVYQFSWDVKSGGGAKRGFVEAMESRKVFSGEKWVFPVMTQGSDAEARELKNWRYLSFQQLLAA